MRKLVRFMLVHSHEKNHEELAYLGKSRRYWGICVTESDSTNSNAGNRMKYLSIRQRDPAQPELGPGF